MSNTTWGRSGGLSTLTARPPAPGGRLHSQCFSRELATSSFRTDGVCALTGLPDVQKTLKTVSASSPWWGCTWQATARGAGLTVTYS